MQIQFSSSGANIVHQFWCKYSPQVLVQISSTSFGSGKGHKFWCKYSPLVLVQLQSSISVANIVHRADARDHNGLFCTKQPPSSLTIATQSARPYSNLYLCTASLIFRIVKYELSSCHIRVFDSTILPMLSGFL